jgi:uncharacterized protein YndB with AHSA1/START domain
MKKHWCALWLLIATVSLPTQAEVLAASAEGFNLKIVTHTRADPQLAYQAFTRIAQWWHPDHTYSGDAANLSLEMSPGGAFLERTGRAGFVKHMELVYANPGAEIRLLGGLGPLQGMGLHGAMTVQFQEGEQGGTRVTMLYNVSGFAQGGLQGLAPIVDRVQGEQMERHAAFADRLTEAD